MSKEKILTIDDDPDILDVLSLTLSDVYDVIQANNGKEGLELAKSKPPSLIIVDYKMPVMDGRKFCQEVKKDILLQHIPIIMLTGKKEVEDKVSGINAGADDYVVKPFEPNELLARIKMILRRTERSLDANPLTHLPGNVTIMEELQRSIDEKKIFAVGYVDLDKFKAYNDKYGFEHGDEVIRETARILIKSVRAKGNPEAFIGHIGGDDFVFIADDDKADAICQDIIQEFDNSAANFYNEKDKNNKYILTKDRQGNAVRIGFLSVSIGIVSNAVQKISHIAQVGEIGAELKKYAKSQEGSAFVRDKRKT
ncbi:MAG: response regulator [Candidatus Omnitrophota bacterium]